MPTTSVIFQRLGRFDVEIGTTVLAASKRFGLFHPDDCGGKCECTSCSIWVINGENNLSSPEEKERRLLAAHHLARPIRLGCQAKVQGPVRVQILARDQEDREILKTQAASPVPILTGTELPLALVQVALHDYDVFAQDNLPYDAIHVLHRFRLLAEGLLQEHGGFLVEAQAGVLLAVFGLEGRIREGITRAVGCARRLAVACQALQEYLERHFDVTLELGIGVHAGLAVVGHVGPANRLVVVGEAREMVARVLHLTREAEATILVSEPVFAVIRDRFPISSAFSARLPGREERANVFVVAPQSSGFVVEQAA